MKKNKGKFKPEKELRETRKINVYRKQHTKNKAFDQDDFESFDEMMDFNKTTNNNQ